jgi:hypothetical protein
MLPSGVEGQSSCYQYFAGPLNWTASRDDCAARGGHLLTTRQQYMSDVGIMNAAVRRWSLPFLIGASRCTLHSYSWRTCASPSEPNSLSEPVFLVRSCFRSNDVVFAEPCVSDCHACVYRARKLLQQFHLGGRDPSAELEHASRNRLVAGRSATVHRERFHRWNRPIRVHAHRPKRAGRHFLIPCSPMLQIRQPDCSIGETIVHATITVCDLEPPTRCHTTASLYCRTPPPCRRILAFLGLRTVS